MVAGIDARAIEFHRFILILQLVGFMKAIDKFGNVIYPSKFSKLKENGKILLANGYFESKSKPNLFCKRIPQGWFYADMRGTEEVPILGKYKTSIGISILSLKYSSIRRKLY